MCPAVGQGALAIETRADGARLRSACAALDHAATRAAVTAERARAGRARRRLPGAHRRARHGGRAAGCASSRVVAAPGRRRAGAPRNPKAPAHDAEAIGRELGAHAARRAARARILDAVYAP